MSVSAPVYQIMCDEPGCGRVQTFLLAASDWAGVYELHAADEVYAHFGGETLADGKHRCAACRAKSTNPPNAPEPHEITERVLRIAAVPSVVSRAVAVINTARRYRRAEQDGTPRLWRGKDLDDKSRAVDEALEIFDGS